MVAPIASLSIWVLSGDPGTGFVNTAFNPWPPNSFNPCPISVKLPLVIFPRDFLNAEEVVASVEVFNKLGSTLLTTPETSAVLGAKSSSYWGTSIASICCPTSAAFLWSKNLPIPVSVPKGELNNFPSKGLPCTPAPPKYLAPWPKP